MDQQTENLEKREILNELKMDKKIQLSKNKIEYDI